MTAKRFFAFLLVLGLATAAWAQWDATFETEPANTDPLGQADDRMREIKQEVRDRLETISDFGELGNVTTDTGRMLAGVARVFSQSAAPSVDGTTSPNCYPEADVDGNRHCSGNELWHDTDDNSLNVSIDSGSDGDADSWQQLAPLGLKTIYVPASAMRPTTTSGSAPIVQVELSAAQPELLVLDFDGTSLESAQFTVGMPKSWDEGDVRFQFFYTVAAAVATTVRFELTGVCAGNDDAINVAYFGGTGVEDTFLNTANDLAISDISSAFTISGSPAEGDVCWFKLVRRPDIDTTTQDARFIGLRLLYDVDAYNDD